MTHTPTALSRRVGAVAATVLLGALLTGCGDDGTESATDPASAPASASPSASPSQAAPDGSTDALPSWAPRIITDGDDTVTGLDFTGVDPPSDKLLVEQVVTGDGPPVEAGQNITANYFGQLADADAPFDESFSGSPFTAPIGVGSLIPGWDQGLVGVPVGSRVIMSIPPDLGYGDAGAGPGIPGGSTLYFVVDILDAA